MADPATALADRLIGAGVATMDLASIAIGDRLGFYRWLGAKGPANTAEFARGTGTHSRYAREWLEHQAVTGLLATDGAGDAATRRYWIADAARRVLADETDLLYLAPLARQIAAAIRQLPAIADAARTGSGVPWSAYGPDMWQSEAALNRPTYLHLLTSAWLPALPKLHRRLVAEPPARVADVGCGAAWSTVAMCRGYPSISVDAYEPDPASAEAARRNVSEASVADRAQVFEAGIEATRADRPYDLITAFECLHDLPRPVETLSAMRRALNPDGTVLIADMKVAETFTVPGDDVERLMYGFSLLVCLPDSMSTPESAATGTVLREPVLRDYAHRAGFSRVEVAPLDHDMWRFYTLQP